MKYLLLIVLLILTGCPSKEPTPQDIFRTSTGVYVQSFQTQDELAVVKFETAKLGQHEIVISCALPQEDGPEVPFLDRLLTRVKDNFILIAASVVLF